MRSDDPALRWLMDNDPAAVSKSGRQYARDIGILTPQTLSDIRAHELTSADPTRAFHCAACQRKSEQAWETVK